MFDDLGAVGTHGSTVSKTINCVFVRAKRLHTDIHGTILVELILLLTMRKNNVRQQRGSLIPDKSPSPSANERAERVVVVSNLGYAGVCNGDGSLVIVTEPVSGMKKHY